MRALTISELERVTGVPRSTIYFYVREGLVPVAQKAAASRAIYTDVHVDLLGRIQGLKDKGLPLHSIREELSPLIDSGKANEVDLVARQAERTRQAILEVAARQFARKGYKRTRIADIIKEVGISPPAFYGHFRTKRQLLMESLRVYVQWSVDALEPALEAEPDLAIRLIRRIGAFYGVQALGSGHLALVRSEALIEDTEMRQVAQETYKALITGILEDLTRLRRDSASPPPVPDELLAFSLEGALEHTAMRATWDSTYSQHDVVLTHLHLYLAVVALYTGELDLSDRLARYSDAIDLDTSYEPPKGRVAGS